MGWIKIGLFSISLSLIFVGCSSLRRSRYAKANTFRYESDQPHFYFENGLLKITGSFAWITWARAIPKVAFLPDTIKHLVQPLSTEHGRILFTAWAPHMEKYNVATDIKVRKSDVRKPNPYNERLFLIVLVSDRPFTPDSFRYIPKGRNLDYQFELFLGSPKGYPGNYW